MLWWIAPFAQAIQAGLRLLNRTRLGRRMKASWSFMGLVRPAEFHRDHSPAFLRGEPPKGTICVYLKLPRFGGQYRTRLQGVDWIFGLS